MNLIEKLLRIDKEKATEREKKKIYSSHLSRILGERTEITITELSGKRLNDITAMMVDKNGNKDYSKMQDMNLMYCVSGVVEPDLRDQRLMEHFGVRTPKDLASILFDSEAGRIAGEIVSLSGLSDDAEDEVKN